MNKTYMRGHILAAGAILATITMAADAATKTAYANPASSEELAGQINQIIEDTRRDIPVIPGLAVAVVIGDEVILAKGYGVADVDSGQQTDTNTRFYIASSTKSLTALAITKLAAEGQIDLDASLQDLLPALQMDAAIDTHSITLRDLLRHTSGIDSNALGYRTAYSGQTNHKGLMVSLNGSTPNENGRAFDYTNFGYVVASMILEEKFGESWKDIVAREVLRPAGMVQTTSSPSTLLQSDVAMPHMFRGAQQRIPLNKRDNNMHAAGGHFSSATDMAKWLEIQLNDGMLDGAQVIPAGIVARTHEPQVEFEQKFYTYQRRAYGLGWNIADYEGDTLIHHFGAFSGYRAHVSFMPEHSIGVAILANDLSPYGFNLPDLMANYIYDVILEKEGLAEKYEGQKARFIANLGRKFPEPVSHTPSRAPELIAGVYDSPAMGTMELIETADGLYAKSGNLSAPVTFREDGTLRVELIPGRGQVIGFDQDSEGQVMRIRYDGADFVRRHAMMN